MTAEWRVRSRRSGALVSTGLLAFAVGVILLAARVLQRRDGRLSWGGRSGPVKTMAREANPRLFDRVTIGLIVSGLVLSVGGLGLAYDMSEDGRGHAREHDG